MVKHGELPLCHGALLPTKGNELLHTTDDPPENYAEWETANPKARIRHGSIHVFQHDNMNMFEKAAF